MSSEKNILEDVFEKFLQGPQIFKNRDVLHSDYIPDNLPHREKQLTNIGKILAPMLQGSRGSNIFLYGKTGTGKTAVIKYVLKYLIYKSSKIGVSINDIYINCRVAGTDYRVLSQLCENLGIEIPFTGLSTGEVFNRFKKGLETKHSLLIVVLDEVDAIIRAQGDDLLYKLTRINENLRNSRLSIIGISNDLHFKEQLDPRVISSLSEEEEVFNPYSSTELHDILLERIKIAFIDGILTSGALNICAALAATDHGDARRALDLLRLAGELAERDRTQEVTEDHVRRARDKMEEDRTITILRTLPIQAKLVFISVYLKNKSQNTELSTGAVYDIYKKVCTQLRFDPLTQRRVSGIINELDITGVLRSKVVSLGRYGRTKKIRIGVPRRIVIAVYSEDKWISQLIS